VFSNTYSVNILKKGWKNPIFAAVFDHELKMAEILILITQQKIRTNNALRIHL